VAIGWLYSNLGKQKALFRVEIVFRGRSTLYLIYLIFALCMDFIVMLEEGEGCVLYDCLKWLYLKKFPKQLSICKT
jgi:hypothetical protein